MGLLARAGYAWVRWKSRHGLREDATHNSGDKKHVALRVGVRGETYAYWYLRRMGYIFIARNYEPAREKGELDLVGFDGETLAFIEVRTRALVPGRPALPELSIGREKHHVLVRTAHAFLRERHVKPCPVRFDVVAIDHQPGEPPVARLHKDALSLRA
ncbi:MAG TPA: YraN family protein [Candidatus Eisenbacteria bacterium]|nr:YraN family protein [Candidatus Eisenbacteria bacterium]